MTQGNHGNPEPQGAPGARGRSGRRSNWRTALVLLSIALVFFVGVIVNRLLLT